MPRLALLHCCSAHNRRFHPPLRGTSCCPQVAKLTDINAAANQRLAKQAFEVQAKAQEARNKMDEQRKNELLVMQMSRQQQVRDLYRHHACPLLLIIADSRALLSTDALEAGTHGTVRN